MTDGWLIGGGAVFLCVVVLVSWLVWSRGHKDERANSDKSRSVAEKKREPKVNPDPPKEKPEIESIEPLPLILEPGKTLLVRAKVSPRGNTDPWTLRIDGRLPRGVRQRPARSALPPRTVGLEIETDTDAPESKSEIVMLTLLADGVRANSRPVTLWVERVKPDVRIGLRLPGNIRLQAGGKTTFTVRLTRNGYNRPIRLEVEDRPKCVSAATVTVPSVVETAEIELKADRDNLPMVDLQEFRVVAYVEGKEVGRAEGRLRLERGRDVP
jgi:hypothetical protein